MPEETRKGHYRRTRAGVAGNCEPSTQCWKLNLYPLPERSEDVTAELFFCLRISRIHLTVAFWAYSFVEAEYIQWFRQNRC